MNAQGQTFCGVEGWDPAGRYDVVVVGIPSSAGSLAGSRACDGPALVRRVSAVLAHRSPGTSGWFDLERDRTLCRGLRIADAGDVGPDAGDEDRPNATLAARLERIRRTCRLLVVLSGDDSWTYEVMATQRGRLLHLDAHEDRNPYQTGALNHANVIGRLLDDQRSLLVGQWGRRGLSPEPPRDCGRHLALRSEAAASAFAAEEGTELHIALDVDVVDPREMSSVTCPLPGGPTLASVEALCRSAAGLQTLSLSEFAPRGDPRSLVEAYALVQLLLRVVDATVMRE